MSKPLSNQVGDAIRLASRACCRSGRAAAEQLGISEVHLSNIVNGNKYPSFSLMERMEKTWGVRFRVNVTAGPELAETATWALQELGQSNE